MENELFEKTPVPKAYLTMALPLVTSMIVTMAYNLADTFFISQTGDTDIIAAVSLCGPVFTMLMAFGNIFGQGGSSLISRKLGARDLEGAKRVSAFCFYGALLTGAVLAVLMLALQGPALSLLGADGAVLAETSVPAGDARVTLEAPAGSGAVLSLELDPGTEAVVGPIRFEAIR